MAESDQRSNIAAKNHVFVEIEYLEVVRGEVCESVDGHRCEDWDDAERYVLAWEWDHRDRTIVSVDMRPVR